MWYLEIRNIYDVPKKELDQVRHRGSIERSCISLKINSPTYKTVWNRLRNVKMYFLHFPLVRHIQWNDFQPIHKYNTEKTTRKIWRYSFFRITVLHARYFTKIVFNIIRLTIQDLYNSRTRNLPLTNSAFCYGNQRSPSQLQCEE